ncbi:MAG: hypothetical protein ABIN74_08235 [Ferruginibacter sp.]
MKYLNIIKNIAVIAIVSLIFMACKKSIVATPMGDAGQTLVKILGGGTPPSIIKKPVDFVPTSTRLLVLEVRRDIPNEAELNKTMIVTLKDDTAAISFYNRDTVSSNPNRTNPNKVFYNQFNPAWFSTSIDGAVKTGGQGGIWTITFKPGEFSKSVYLTIPDATLLNPSSLYAIGFTILTADAGAKISTQKSSIVEIGAKNNWDGVYKMSGTFSDVSNAAFTYYGDQQFSLITVGASTCIVRNDDLNGGIPGYLFLNAGTGTYYGSFGLVITFNPVTNTISDLHNYYGDPAFPPTVGGTPATGTGAPLYAASNTRRAVLDPSGVNAVQGKDIVLKYWLVQPSVIPAPPSIRSYFSETWKYIGPR